MADEPTAPAPAAPAPPAPAPVAPVAAPAPTAAPAPAPIASAPPAPAPAPAPIIDPEKEQLKADLATARENERVRKEKELIDAGNWKALAESREAENKTLRDKTQQLETAATIGKSAEAVLLGSTYNFDPSVLPSVLALIDLSAAKVDSNGQIVGVEEAVTRAAAKHAALFGALPKRGAPPAPTAPADPAQPNTFMERMFGSTPRAAAPPTQAPAINPNPAPVNLAERKPDGTFVHTAEDYSAIKRRLTSPATYRGASRRGI